MKTAYRTLLCASFFVLISGSIAFAQQDANTLETLSKKVVEMSKKIDQITQSQAEILRKLDDISAQVDVVKIRATHR